MKRIFCLLFCLSAATLLAQTNPPAPIPLFNGRNLDGFFAHLEDSSVNPATIWSVENGVLRCTGTTRGYVRTVMPYADYKLTVDWRWPKDRGNSGVLLHIVNQDLVWPKSIEAQLATGRAGDFAFLSDARAKEEKVGKNPRGISTGRLARPGESAEKPLGEWNTYEIICSGDTITLTYGDRSKGSRGRNVIESFSSA